jgi:hypothetical protein
LLRKNKLYESSLTKIMLCAKIYRFETQIKIKQHKLSSLIKKKLCLMNQQLEIRISSC